MPRPHAHAAVLASAEGELAMRRSAATTTLLEVVVAKKEDLPHAGEWFSLLKNSPVGASKTR